MITQITMVKMWTSNKFEYTTDINSGGYIWKIIFLCIYAHLKISWAKNILFWLYKRMIFQTFFYGTNNRWNSRPRQYISFHKFCTLRKVFVLVLGRRRRDARRPSRSWRRDGDGRYGCKTLYEWRVSFFKSDQKHSASLVNLEWRVDQKNIYFLEKYLFKTVFSDFGRKMYLFHGYLF